jgi:hypothetical protein
MLRGRAVALLKDLIHDKTSANRIARIQQELNLVYTRGYVLACKWREREPQPDDAAR